MPREVQNLNAAMMPVSKSPVWEAISTYLREAQWKTIDPPYAVSTQTFVKLKAKMTRNAKTQRDCVANIRYNAATMRLILC